MQQTQPYNDVSDFALARITDDPFAMGGAAFLRLRDLHNKVHHAGLVEMTAAVW